MPTWNPRLVLGVKVIDAEHMELFNRADALLGAMREQRSAQEVKPLLAFLDDYCSRHFENEEQLMRERKYPALAEHAAQHAAFRKQLRGILDRFHFKGSSATVTLDAQQFISGLVQHIGRNDVQLAGFLVGGGLATKA